MRKPGGAKSPSTMGQTYRKTGMSVSNIKCPKSIFLLTLILIKSINMALICEPEDISAI